MAHREAEARCKALREEVKTIKKDYDKTEDDLKALQSVGQIIGEVLRQLDEERCECGRRGGGGPLAAPIGRARGLAAPAAAAAVAQAAAAASEPRCRRCCLTRRAACPLPPAAQSS